MADQSLSCWLPGHLQETTQKLFSCTVFIKSNCQPTSWQKVNADNAFWLTRFYANYIYGEAERLLLQVWTVVKIISCSKNGINLFSRFIVKSKLKLFVNKKLCVHNCKETKPMRYERVSYSSLTVSMSNSFHIQEQCQWKISTAVDRMNRDWCHSKSNIHLWHI